VVAARLPGGTKIVCNTEHLFGNYSVRQLIWGTVSRMNAAATRSPGPGPGRRSPDGCTLSNDLGWALGVLSRCYVKAVTATLADVPGGPRGYQVLAAAARDEHGSQLALAQHLGVDRTVMTYLLDSLAQVGLIERRPDPADRRARRIVATARGRALLDELGERLRAAEDQVLAGLDSEADRLAFRAQLQRLAVHAATALDSAGLDACNAERASAATIGGC
jgi:DNA-binding MarR family transcriptional regulator